MGQAQPPSYYDSIYANPDSPYRLFVDSPWMPLWEWASKHCVGSVLDMGCGVGWMGALTPQNSLYIGVDFSQVAINRAMAHMAEGGRRRATAFLCMSLPAPVVFHVDTLVATEFLEHVQDDLGCLAMVPAGTRIVATVPRADDPAHVRTFPTFADVTKRYSDVVEFGELLALAPNHIGFVGKKR